MPGAVIIKFIDTGFFAHPGIGELMPLRLVRGGRQRGGCMFGLSALTSIIALDISMQDSSNMQQETCSSTHQGRGAGPAAKCVCKLHASPPGPSKDLFCCSRSLAKGGWLAFHKCQP
eukprot:1156056-Pelagomonas_calceolata.AAC.12